MQLFLIPTQIYLRSLYFLKHYLSFDWTSGCGTSGIAIASNARGHGFESSRQKINKEYLFSVNWPEKTKIKKEEASNDPFINENLVYYIDI